MCVVHEGEFYSAFQRDTYIARVRHDNGFEAIVILPDGSAQFPTKDLIPSTFFAAGVAKATGQRVVRVAEA